jgi:hypothetical protein
MTSNTLRYNWLQYLNSAVITSTWTVQLSRITWTVQLSPVPGLCSYLQYLDCAVISNSWSYFQYLDCAVISNSWSYFKYLDCAVISNSWSYFQYLDCTVIFTLAVKSSPAPGLCNCLQYMDAQLSRYLQYLDCAVISSSWTVQSSLVSRRWSYL